MIVSAKAIKPRERYRLNLLSLRLIKVNTAEKPAGIGLHLYRNIAMNKLRWLRLLMGITILAIAAFQVYWLKENYDREKKSLEIRTSFAFREAFTDLQAKKFKLNIREDSSRNGKVKIYWEGENEDIRLHPKKEIISSINIIRDKYKDSLQKLMDEKKGLIISMNQTTSYSMGNDSIRVQKNISGPSPGSDLIFSLLFGADSLQEPLTLAEIRAAVKLNLEQKGIRIPFDIIQTDSTGKPKRTMIREFTDRRTFVREIGDHDMNEMTVGFANPVTYTFKTGNAFPYLLRQISLPVLFSVLLLGITVVSFILLYKNLLKQQRLAALKNEFISNITHELKTPIATVGVAIEALKNFNAIRDPQRTKEYLDISSNELHRLSLLVDKVLKLSMFENKGVELKYETLDLKDLSEEVITSLKLQAEKYRAELVTAYEGDTVLQGDRLHLLSVIFNLVDNALKYSKDNPEIRVKVTGDERMVRLSVSDNGIGIAPEYRQKVFEKFFRVPHGDTHNAKGYGLGLSYVAQVVKKHGGTIDVESRPGSGTTFVITLPKLPA